MKKIRLFSLISLFIIFNSQALIQSTEFGLSEFPTTLLFTDDKPLTIKLKYSIKQIKRETNDSTYMPSHLSYMNDSGKWVNMDVRLRVRGNSRLKLCHYPPIKIKIPSGNGDGTVFDGNRKLKLVLPCLNEQGMNDNVLKEFMAYKIYEQLTEAHYKTRLVNLIFEHERKKNVKTHEFMAFLQEDIANVAERINGNEMKRRVHPLQQNDEYALTNSFFQFMIGNTDFSLMYRHNEKIIFADKKIIPVPYDFDMSGLVNASYAVVSNVPGFNAEITEVTERVYKGYQRDIQMYEEVRKKFLDKKIPIYNCMNALRPYFKSTHTYSETESYITSFYKLLEDDKRYQSQIVKKARSKS
jgi:hypothetical protein